MDGPVRHGQNDLCQVDTSYKPRFWQNEFPVDAEERFIEHALSRQGVKGAKSLRMVCGETAARNSHLMSVEALKLSPWKGACDFVWRSICLLGRDSFGEFAKFAEAFSRERDFQCHHHSENDSIRRGYLLSYSFRPSQRIEFVSPQVSIGSLVSSLNALQFENLVLLDLSEVELTDQTYLDVMSLRKLEGLDVSTSSPGSPISDSILRSWSIATKNQWTRLRILRLNGRVAGKDNMSFVNLLRSNIIYVEGQSLSDSKLASNRLVGEDANTCLKLRGHKKSLAELYLRLRAMETDYGWKIRPKHRTLILDLIMAERSWKRKAKGKEACGYLRIQNEPEELKKRRHPPATVRQVKKTKGISATLSQFL
ncbi:hypothetical protein TRICI_001231 [Trichomonascus ciferrii]|uniref:Uncharacterized protein n=1 Tax=Trichomonascus ciferrii TaxID=44093 RepID=A0A642VCJ0_9ASCO|nr:hypothetical protein TRICI_001231 [Trichomonascus ciferrii]